jgi:hypothetical protein
VAVGVAEGRGAAVVAGAAEVAGAGADADPGAPDAVRDGGAGTDGVPASAAGAVAEGAVPSEEAVAPDSPAVGTPVRSCSPRTSFEGEEPEKENPAITAASDTAPSAPAAAAARRPRRAGGLRREWRGGRGAPSVTLGSSAVAS